MKEYFSILVFWRLSFWTCLISVLLLALMPTSIDIPATGWDKLNHVLAFGALSFLSFRAYSSHHLRWLALLLAYGGLIEIIQSFTSYRFAEWADLLADGLGLGIGGILELLTRFFIGKMPQRS